MAEQGFYIRQWSCVNSHAAPGDAVLLKKTGKGLTGIIASGTILSTPYQNRHWGKGREGEGKQYVQVRFNRLVDYTKDEIFPVRDKDDFGFVPYASGCQLDDIKAASLLQRFHQYAMAPTIQPKPAIKSTDRKRLNLSVRLRYEIFDRDAHTCRYCGRSSPAVKLHVDHVISQDSWRARFGSFNNKQTINGLEYDSVNDQKNLVTSCQDCNLGKSTRIGKPPQ